jgi:hypothetical protein
MNEGWCTRPDGSLTEGGYISPTKKGRRPKHVRCPECGRRLVPRTINYEPFGRFEAGYTLPTHKLRKKKKKWPARRTDHVMSHRFKT